MALLFLHGGTSLQLAVFLCGYPFPRNMQSHFPFGGRKAHMANVTINYQPTPKQAMFHASKANEILYGGAAGGGKRRRSSWMPCSGV